VRRAVVHDPEHAAGRGVRFGGHDLLDQGSERGDAGGRRAPADHLPTADVEGGQVGQRTATVVFVLDAGQPGPAGWQGGVAAAAGLHRGLLVGADHVVALAQRFVLPEAGVQVEHDAGLGGEVRIRREDPGPVSPGSDRVGGQPPRDRGCRDVLDDAGADGLVGQLGGA
jgi:hypothetical protein